MNNRVLVLGSVLLSGAIVALGWFLGVAPRLADAAMADAERQSVAAQNEGLQAQLVQLRDDFDRIDELRDGVAALRASVPDSADYAGFVAELNGLAASTGASVSRLSIGDASWYSGVQSSADAAPTEDAPVAPPEGVASAEGAPTEAAAGPVQVPIDTSLVNGSNFVAIPVTIEVTADYDQAVALMGALQSDKRLFLVTGFAYGGAAEPRIDGLLYVLLD